MGMSKMLVVLLFPLQVFRERVCLRPSYDEETQLTCFFYGKFLFL